MQEKPKHEEAGTMRKTGTIIQTLFIQTRYNTKCFPVNVDVPDTERRKMTKQLAASLKPIVASHVSVVKPHQQLDSTLEKRCLSASHDDR